MPDRTSFGYGAITRLAGRSSGAILTVVALHEATRYFGRAGWGEIATAIAWAGVFVALGAPGVSTYAMREISRLGADQRTVLTTATRAVATLSFGAGLLALASGAVVYLHHPREFDLVALAAAWIPCYGLLLLAGSVLASLGRSDLRALLDILSSLLLLVATLFIVRFGANDIAYLVGFTASMGCAAGLAVVLARHASSQATSAAGPSLGDFIRSALPLGQVDLFSAVYGRADSLLLYFVTGTSAIALYSVAYQVATFIMVMPGFLAGALAGEFVRAGVERRRELAAMAMLIALAVAIPIPLFFGVFAHAFIDWLSGSSFAGAAPVLVILSIAASLALLNGLMFQLAVFVGLERRMWRTVAVVTSANIIANAVAIPIWGARGAAAAMIVSEIVGLLRYWPMFCRATGYRLMLDQVGAVVLASSLTIGVWIAAVSIYGLSSGRGISILARAVAFGVVYLGALYGFLALLGRRRRALSATTPEMN